MATGLASGLSGTGMRQIKLPTMSAPKANFFNQIMGQAQPAVSDAVSQLSGIASGGNEEMWNRLEAPTMRQFAGLQGNLASRFSGMGSGARNSSGFQNAAGEQAAGLAEQLASNRMEYQESARKQLMDLYSQIMGTSEFDTFLTQKQKKQPWWKSALGTALPLIGAGVGGAFGGPMGMAMGGQLGAGLGGSVTGSGGGFDFGGLGKMPNKWS